MVGVAVRDLDGRVVLRQLRAEGLEPIVHEAEALFVAVGTDTPHTHPAADGAE